MPDDELIQTILDYWAGISQLMPSAFRSPRSYSIQRTIGVFVMHRVARKVFKKCLLNNDMSSSAMVSILRPAVLQYLNDKYWVFGGPARSYSSGSGQKELADNIAALL